MQSDVQNSCFFGYLDILGFKNIVKHNSFEQLKGIVEKFTIECARAADRSRSINAGKCKVRMKMESGIHVVGVRSWSCDLYQHLHRGVNLVFHAEVEEFDRFSMFIGCDGTEIHATINARSKPCFFGGNKTIEKKFTIPNHFRAI